MTISDDHYEEFLERSRENAMKDCTLIVNNCYRLEANSAVLRFKSKFFNNLMSHKFRKEPDNIYELNIPGNIVLLEILINFLTYNYLVVPESMTWLSWIELYHVADYLALSHIKDLAICFIESLIDIQSVEDIFSFAQEEQI